MDTTTTNSDGLSSSSDSVQLGGRGYHHKRGCKCPICKKGKKSRKYKRGGEMTEEETFKDLEIGPVQEEETFKDLEIGEPEYNPDAPEMVGGKRLKRRKTRKYSKGGKKSRKSRRKSRKSNKSRK